MRIRKRHALLVEPPQPTRSPLAAVKNSIGDEHYVGQQDKCTCCSRLRRLQNGELGIVSFERESDKPSNRFANGISLADKNQIIDAEEKEPNAATTIDLLGGLERVRSTEQNTKANGARKYNDGEFHCPEGDLNHPGNRPKESLLYSLYCVFSKLSGKAVLTAREALSRIIEERLPGLDEETGLPSVQVAKVMRSNPYFVHLEGGKFFLCSDPSSSDSKEDGDSPEDVVDSDQPRRSTSPFFPSKVNQARNPFTKAESLKEKQQHQQQTFSNVEATRTKRPRSKEVGTINVDGTVEETKCRPSGSKREGQQKALRARNSTSEQGNYGAEPVEHICKRYDGRGWKCHEVALPGYSMCRHHHELIVNRLARLRSSGRLGSKKSGRKRRTVAKPVKEGLAPINEGEISVNNQQNDAYWWKNVKARSLKSINT
ncbi:unnamed protein product [Calypogeia fissa]